MIKDRARPFSKKHRKYWIPVTGGMIFIGILNIAIGFCSYDPPSDTHDRIHVVIPPPAYQAPPPEIAPTPRPPSVKPGPAGGSGSATLAPDAHPVDAAHV